MFSRAPDAGGKWGPVQHVKHTKKTCVTFKFPKLNFACLIYYLLPNRAKIQNTCLEVVVLDWPLNIYTYNGCQKDFPQDICTILQS